jgi:hypothetical protein
MRPPSRLLSASIALLATCILSCGPDARHAITGTVTMASAVTVNLSGAVAKTTTTDGSGGYAFTDLADGAYTVTPAKDGYTFTPASRAVSVAGADVAEQDFAATFATHVVGGTISGAGTVTVNLTGAAAETTTTDANGGYAFIGLADGAYTVTPSKAGYKFAPTEWAVTVSGADVVGVDFAATPAPYAISGSISGAGTVRVNLTGAATRTTTTDDHGNYAFTSLADGGYTVTPVETGYTFTPASRAVTVSGADLVGVDFAATPAPYSISGSISGASAVTVNLTGAATRTTTTDGHGGYAFFGLADGDYTVTPVKTGYTITPASLAVTVSGADVAGRNFVASPVRLTLAGTVTGADAVLIEVSIGPLLGPKDLVRSTTTDANGHYSCTVNYIVPTGTPGTVYMVKPSKAGYTFTPSARYVPTTTSASGLDFAVTPPPP